jgi:hypothetical protein
MDDGVPAIKCWLALQTLSVASNFAKCTPIEICRQIFVTGDDHSALGQIFVIASGTARWKIRKSRRAVNANFRAGRSQVEL